MDADDETRRLFLSAVSLHQQGELAAAEREYRAVIEKSLKVFQAHHNLGLVLGSLGKLVEAEQCFRTALALKPDYPTALNSLGGLLQRKQRFDKAVAAFEQALVLRPDYTEALVNLTNTLLDMKRLENAEAPLQRALLLAPNNADVQSTLARARLAIDDLGVALDALTRAVASTPDSGELRCALFTQRKIACAWENVIEDETFLLNEIRSGQGGVVSTAAFSLATTAEDQLRCARTRATALTAACPQLNLLHRGPRAKIRLGYLSYDFRHHATTVLAAGLFEQHDRSRFEVVAFSHGPNDGSALRERIVSVFDRFIDVSGHRDVDIAGRIREEGIDILVDLNGYNTFALPGIVALRSAPIQVNFLGFPGTMGADFIDYIVADAHLIPPAQEVYFSENVVLMPDSYQPNDRNREISPLMPSRNECGLPEQGFVFCCFNASYKLGPAFFDIWMGLLRDTPQSVLWLLASNSLSVENLRKEARDRGIDPQRLVFASPVLPADHLARHRLADLSLDTLPCNAHTTMSDALGAGVPAVTCVGSSLTGRVGASLLHSVGLDEMITHTPHDYDQLIRRLVADPDRLHRIRARLSANLATAPLFDTPRYTRALEAAYAEMWRRHIHGEPPRRIVVSELSPAHK